MVGVGSTDLFMKMASTFDNMSPIILGHILSFLNAKNIAKAEQSCRSFKVIIPRVARERERVNFQTWSSKHDMNEVTTKLIKIPTFLTIIKDKTVSAFASTHSKGWCESLFIQELGIKECGQLSQGS